MPRCWLFCYIKVVTNCVKLSRGNTPVELTPSDVFTIFGWYMTSENPTRIHTVSSESNHNGWTRWTKRLPWIIDSPKIRNNSIKVQRLQMTASVCESAYIHPSSRYYSGPLKNCRLTIQIRGIRSTSGSCTFVKYIPVHGIPWRYLLEKAIFELIE